MAASETRTGTMFHSTFYGKGLRKTAESQGETYPLNSTLNGIASLRIIAEMYFYESLSNFLKFSNGQNQIFPRGENCLYEIPFPRRSKLSK